LTGDLGGVTVVELSGVGPASRCARVLGDLGARWVRVVPPPTVSRIDPPWHSYGAYRGAQLLHLDLKADAGPDVLARVAAHADVLIESFRPGVADRLGIGYGRLSALHPGIIYCSLTGYGQTGPRAALAGHDLNYAAVAGALATGRPRSDGGPSIPGVTMADSAGGGWQAAIRILAAIVARQQTGQGRYLDVSASDGMLQLMALAIDEYFATGLPPTPGGTLLTGGFACYDTYEAADGRWLAVAALEPRFFANLCAALGRPELAPLQYDDNAQAELRRTLASIIRTRRQAEWVDLLGPLDTCVSAVLTIEEVATDAHWHARDAFCDFEGPDHRWARQVCPFGDGPCGARGNPPGPGATHTDQVLTDAGFAAGEIIALRAARVVR
jgi:crotonobetainyl-CoA:carnitine CoA-transferase CaiB-like acyl-CoA transferase